MNARNYQYAPIEESAREAALNEAMASAEWLRVSLEHKTREIDALKERLRDVEARIEVLSR